MKSAVKNIDVDHIWRTLGPWGKYQWKQLSSYLFICVSWVIHQLSIVFIGYRPNFTCKAPPGDPSATNVSSSNNVTVVYGECTIDTYVNTTEDVRKISSIPCTHGWDYDAPREQSFVSEWDFVCEHAELAELSQSLLIVGMMLGNLVAPTLSDKYGRKPVMVFSHVILFAIVLGTAFSSNYLVMVILRILTGAVSQGALSGTTLAIESFPVEVRHYTEVLALAVWTTAICIMSPIAYALRNVSWRYLQITFALMSAWSLVQWWMLDESLRWVIANGQMKRAKEIIKNACKWNNKNYEEVIAQIGGLNDSTLPNELNTIGRMNENELAERDTLVADEAVAERDTLVADEAVAERDTLVADEAVAERDTLVADEAVAERDTLVADEAVAERDTLVADEAVAERDTLVADEAVAERDTLVADEAVAERDTLVADEAVAERDTLVADEAVAERDTLVADEAVAERDTLVADEAVADVTLEVKHYSVLDIVRHKNIFRVSLIVWYTWIVDSLVYYGLFMISSDLYGDRYINFFLSAIIEYPASVFEFFALSKIGRKWTVVICHMVAAVALVVATALTFNAGGNTHMLAAGTAFTLIGKMGITGAFSSAYVTTPELYPTNMRNSGLGVASFMGKVGAMIAPFSRNFSKRILWLPACIYSVLCIVTVFLFAFVPETNGVELPQTIDELTEWYRVNKFELKFGKNRHAENKDQNVQ